MSVDTTAGSLLTVRRGKQLRGQGPAFDIVFNGRTIGTILADEELQWNVEPGTHSLFLRTGVRKRQVGRPVTLHIAEDSFIEVRAVPGQSLGLVRKGPPVAIVERIGPGSSCKE